MATLITTAKSLCYVNVYSQPDLHRNEQSKALLLRLGFTYEGNLRQRYLFDNRFEDEHYFGLLRDEWL